MPKKLVTRKVQQDYRAAIQQLLSDLSQPLVVVQESPMFVDCPNCVWDSINKKSANIFDASFTVPTVIFSGTDQQRTLTPISFTSGRCPVCIGEGQLFTSSEVCIPALINYYALKSKDGNYFNLPAGKEGVSYVQIKTHDCYYELLRANHTFVIYGTVKCEKLVPPFVRGLGGENAVCEMWVQTVEVGETTTTQYDSQYGRDIDPRRKIKGPSDLQILRGQVKGR